MEQSAIQALTAASPLGSLTILAIWGVVMKQTCRFKRPSRPWWPDAENPGLSLELAGSTEDVTKTLGEAGSAVGNENRKTAIRFQKLDFVFIPLYVLFLSAAAVANRGSFLTWPILCAAVITGLFDVLEDLRIIRMVRGVRGSSARPLGKMKWLFYFITLAAEGSIFIFAGPTLAGVGFGILLLAIGIGGAISSFRGRFSGILSAANFSVVALFGLALAPLLALSPVPIREVAEYAVLMRVPLAVALLLVLLPFISFFTGARSLLHGLFDLTPLSLFVVTLTSFAVAGTACMTACIILAHGAERIGIVPDPIRTLPRWWFWPLLMVLLSLPVLIFSVWLSAKQNRRLGLLLIAAVSGSVASLGIAAVLIAFGLNVVSAFLPFLFDPRLEQYLANTHLFAGYVAADGGSDPWPDHIRALSALACTLVLYALVGIYGWSRLGKSRTVPALCSALMLMMMLAWMLSTVAFFFDAWHIPTLLIVGVVGALTAQSNQSDHYYELEPRVIDTLPPDPLNTIAAGNRTRVIVAAANGGGIQAGAWAAQVLYGLHADCQPDFLPSLRMISSVSGGSVGNAFFVNWVADNNVKRPDVAAAESSLDEVAWGLAWPDFLRALCPWPFGNLIGRGRAIEKAWCLNSAGDEQTAGHLDKVLSSWNAGVAEGKLPAVVMNATLVESGCRLLLATTRMNKANAAPLAEVDATDLHTINGTKYDVGIVTAARLSATFPYVTPASRSTGFGPQPHVVDGGYYDNYGMATMVEWLDEALSDARKETASVLVIQIHGSPLTQNQETQAETKNRGWFYQAIAPLLALAAVRSAGQVAHNEIELGLLQAKWAAAGIPVHSVTFEFPGEDAPLSWHLTREETDQIRSAWFDGMKTCRGQVQRFLKGHDDLDCGCPCCRHRPHPTP